jgi:hypothetical protein
MEDKTADSLKLFDLALKQLISIYQNNFCPIFLERELAVAWRNRAEVRLELLGPQPTPERLQEIKSDLDKANSRLIQFVQNWPEHHDYHALHAQNLRSYGRLARINNSNAEASQKYNDAIEQIDLACKLNPDEKRYPKFKEKLTEELKEFGTDQTKVGKYP